MRQLYILLLAAFLGFFNQTRACNGLSVNLMSNTDLGNGQYLLTIEVCEFVSNYGGMYSSSGPSDITGILLTVNGANIVGANPSTITGVTQGTTVGWTQTASNQIEYGVWGSSTAPLILAYGNPVECWTFYITVDSPAATVDVLSSSFVGSSPPGGGMTSVSGGLWGCGVTVIVPPITCVVYTTQNISICSGEDFTYPDGVSSTNIMVDETHVSNLTTGSGCDSIITTNVAIVSATSSSMDYTLCSGSNYTYVDGTVSTNITANESNVSILVSVNGCDSLLTETINIYPEYSNVENINLCTGSDYTYPDGSTSTNITVSESYTSNFTTVNGCDSIITTNISVIISTSSTANYPLCSGDDFTYPDGTTSTNITVSESHTSNLTTVNGCDSIITTNISVVTSISSTANYTLCSGDDFTYPDGTTSMNITVSESHTSNLTTMNGCDSIITTNISVILSTSSTANYTLCSGDDFTYSDGTMSAAISANETHISHLLSANGCDSIVTENIVILPLQSNTETVNICEGDDYTYPDGTASTNILIDETQTSHFINTSGCDSIIITNVIVSPAPVADAGPSVFLCQGDSVLINSSGQPGELITWSGGIINGEYFSPSITNTYTLTLTSLGGCSSSDDLEITVTDIPTANFSADILSGCSPLTVNFTNLSSGGPFGNECVWDFGDGTSSSGCASIQHVYTQSGLFTVTLTVTNLGGCSDSITFTDYIEVISSPIASFYSTNSALNTYDSETQFINTSTNASSYIWNFGDGSGNETIENPYHTFPNENGTTYTIMLVANNGQGCSDTTYLTIPVNEVLIYWVPNAFTPDGDAFNQTFQPVFTSGYDPFDYTFLIFNRWGEVIFESHDDKIGWDGTYGINGRSVQDGVYTWKIEFKETMTDKRHTSIGHVNILR